jgi:prevent-host-death family protein
MYAIGVGQLKARLRVCLNRVRAGERITVTDRGRAIAMLAPIEAPRSMDWVRAMVAEGRARWHGGKPTGLAVKIKSRGEPASKMVIDDRR